MFSGGMQGMAGMHSNMQGGVFDLSDLMGGSMGGSIGNPLSGMMGNMNRQNHNKIENIEVTLDDLYIGAKKTIVSEIFKEAENNGKSLDEVQSLLLTKKIVSTHSLKNIWINLYLYKKRDLKLYAWSNTTTFY